MDRQIVYPGAIPLETDLLNTNKYAMMGLAKLAAALMGSNTYMHGLACTPSSPASMVVNVAKGQIYSLQNVDGTAYSSLAADTTNTILKQGVVLNSTAFTLTAPTTAGQSINYLIQVAYNDTDSGATVLPYYNAANPSVAYSGPNNAGTAQNTVRSGVCTVALKAGVAATTGTQTTPAADTGYTAAWVITVAQGATTITASNIALAANAPFLPAAGIFSAVQQGTMTYAADTGAANAYVASFVPALPALIDGMRLTFKAKAANTSTSTLAANGGTAYPIYSHAHQALQGGEIIANGLIEVEWNSTLTAWVLCGNSGGALPVAAATQSNHALQLGQAVGRLVNTQVISSTGTCTLKSGTKKVRVKVWGPGGSGAVSNTSGAGAASGAGGAYVEGIYDVSSITSLDIVIGIGGAALVGGQTANGNDGGTTSITALGISCGGGKGGGGTQTGGVVTSPTTGTILSSPGQNGQGNTSSLGGIGGASFSTYGGLPHTSTAGDDGAYPGGGGAGGSNSGTSRASGKGANGLVIIEEYA
ncbi:MAG: phage tail protein [Pantoea vagans]|nr:phage tail protein [Pantoea vagans]